MTSSIKEHFDTFEWHDATLMSIAIDRMDPGNRDEIAVAVEWPSGVRNRLVFTDCYLFTARMNFGIIASESILSATCSAEAPEVDQVRETCRRYGADFPDLHRFLIETNSTGSLLCIVARGLRVHALDECSAA